MQAGHVFHILSILYILLNIVFGRLPSDAVIIPMITRSAPKGFMLLIEEDRVYRARCPFFEGERVAHLC